MMAAGRLFCVEMIVKKPETQVLLHVLKFSRRFLPLAYFISPPYIGNTDPEIFIK